ncbi:MAG: hypothetical protein E7164_02975 [Firmicutes bacterium]|nr:hypothetical protein [Bacillota bacterium]
MDIKEVYLLARIYEANNINYKEIKAPYAYMKENIDYLLDSNCINYVYQSIISLQDNQEFKKNEVILLLVRNYIKYNYNRDNALIRYFSNSSVDEIMLFFSENEHFANELIKSFYTFLESPKERKNPEDESYGLLLKYEPSLQIQFLANLLRDAFKGVYPIITDFAKTLGLSPSETFVNILDKKIIMSGNPEIVKQLNLLIMYRSYLIRLMYADLYENAVAQGQMVKSNLIISQIVNRAITSGVYDLPKDAEELHYFLWYFNYLVDSQKVRESNRKAMKNEEIHVLNKINPLWMLDEKEIVNKR